MDQNMSLRIRVASVAAILITHAMPGTSLDAQPPVPLSAADTIGRGEDTLGLSFGVSQRRNRFVFASGKTYNRVEGLPVHFGPVLAAHVGGARFSLEAFGILRSANTFEWDSDNRGHVLTGEVRSLRPRGFGLKAATYDIVAPVEDWQMPAGEAGLAAFFLHRDYRDHFGRHGRSVTASLFDRRGVVLEGSIASERWVARDVRQVLTVLRNNHRWRPNPEMDEGRANLLTIRGVLDTRNDTRRPSTGWLTRIEYEYGDIDFTQLAPTSATVRSTVISGGEYGRAIMDLRRYNQVSPESQLNFRLVAGGWLHGDELPLQKRFSVGGPATIPAAGFRDVSQVPDVFTCSDGDAPPGSPAQCERVALVQLEYRHELPYRPGTIFGGTPLRIRSTALTMRPVLVLFADAGRGWLVDPPFSGWRTPGIGSFSSDLGAGVDLGLLGTYVAVSLTESGTPVRFFIRARSRF